MISRTLPLALLFNLALAFSAHAAGVVVNTPYGHGAVTIDSDVTNADDSPANSWLLSGTGVPGGSLSHGTRLVHGLSGTVDKPGRLHHGMEKPILDAWGNHWMMRDLEFYGNPAAAVGSRPDLAMVLNGGDGAGGFKSEIRNVSIQGFELGIMLGNITLGSNSDNLSVRDLWINQCTTGIEFTTQQVVNVNIDFAHILNCGTFFRFRGGGDFTAAKIDTAHSASTVVLLDPVSNQIGPANAVYHVEQLVIDESNFNASNIFYPLRCTARVNDVLAVFERVHVKIGAAATPGSVVWHMNGSASQVTLRDCYWLPQKCLWGENGATFVLDSCRLNCEPEELWHPSTAVGTVLELENCLKQDGTRIRSVKRVKR